MNKIVTILLFLAILFCLPGFTRVASADEVTVDTGTVIAADDPILYTDNAENYYTQRVLVRIDSGYYKNLESETVYSFPVPGMKRALEIGDRVEISYDVQNASQPLQIRGFERKSVLTIVPVILIFAVAAVFIKKRLDFIYVLFTLLCPVATFAAIYYAKLPPVPIAIVIATLLGTIALLLHYTKLIPTLSALLSFTISYGIGALIIYAVANTLNIFDGIFEPLLAYSGVSLPDNLSQIINAGLLIIPFAAILAVVLQIVNRVIKARSLEGENSKAELVKLGITEGLAASKDAVFSFFAMALGFLLPIVIALAGTQDILEILNSEVFSFLVLLGIAPVFMCLIAIFTSAIVTGILLGSATPHRLVTEREAKELFVTTPPATPPQDPQKN